MQKRRLIAAAMAAAMLVASVQTSNAVYYPKKVVVHGGGMSAAPWFIIGCAGGIILAALAANYRRPRADGAGSLELRILVPRFPAERQEAVAERLARRHPYSPAIAIAARTKAPAERRGFFVGRGRRRIAFLSAVIPGQPRSG